jgi:signal transduction histidine kinase
MSLRTRVTLGTVVVLAAGLIVVSVALNLLLANRLSADADSVLGSRAAAVMATLEITRDGTLEVRDAPDDAALDDHAWVFGPAGEPLARSPATPRVARVVTSLARTRARTYASPTEHLRLLAQPVGDDGGAGVVVVGVSMDPYRHTERIAGLGTVVLDLFVLLAGALAARAAVGAALRPVADMTARAARWSEHDLHRRFALGPPRDELTGLAATLDALLGRIDAALRHEQRLSAEIAHELRTPLAGVRAEAELALARESTGAELREALRAVLDGTDRMSAVIETLLAAARSDGVRGAGDAVAAVRAAERVIGPAAAAHHRRVVVHAADDPMPVGAGEEVVAGALHPLLENAVRHAAHEVEVRVVRGEDGQVVIAVADDGEGIAAADAERIFEPGVSAAGGAGLGLPLARRLARAAGGEVTAIPQRGGRVELRLPG